MPYFELKDTTNGMVSADYKDRFIAEYIQNKVRYNKLKSFVGKIKYAKYAGVDEPKHDCPTDLLEKQLFTMGLYLALLEVRAKEYEHIKLPVVEEFAPNINSDNKSVNPKESSDELHSNYPTLKAFLDNAKVGEIISVPFKNGETYEIVKYHNGVLGTRDCPFEHEMNEDGRKKADWNTCDMKPFIEKWFDDNAPDELKELCSVTIPSATNVFGNKYQGRYYKDDESEFQFDYFKDWHNRIKTKLKEEANEEGWWYWLRSPSTDYASYFVVVSGDGSVSYSNANRSRGVALCFLKK